MTHLLSLILASTTNAQNDVVTGTYSATRLPDDSAVFYAIAGNDQKGYLVLTDGAPIEDAIEGEYTLDYTKHDEVDGVIVASFNDQTQGYSGLFFTSPDGGVDDGEEPPSSVNDFLAAISPHQTDVALVVPSELPAVFSGQETQTTTPPTTLPTSPPIELNSASGVRGQSARTATVLAPSSYPYMYYPHNYLSQMPVWPMNPPGTWPRPAYPQGPHSGMYRPAVPMNYGMAMPWQLPYGNMNPGAFPNHHRMPPANITVQSSTPVGASSQGEDETLGGQSANGSIAPPNGTPTGGSHSYQYSVTNRSYTDPSTGVMIVEKPEVYTSAVISVTNDEGTTVTKIM